MISTQHAFFFFSFLLAIFASGRLPADEERWLFEPLADPLHQGIDPNKELEFKIDPVERALTFKQTRPSEKLTFNRQLHNIDSRYYSDFEIELKVEAEGKQNEGPLKPELIFVWNTPSQGSHSAAIPVAVDGKFHTAKLELDKLNGFSSQLGQRKEPFHFELLFNFGKSLDYADVSIKSIRFSTARAGEAARIQLGGNYRITILENCIKGAEVRKISLSPECIKQTQELRRDFDAIAQSAAPMSEKLASYLELEKRYSKLHAYFTAYRELTFLLEDFADLEKASKMSEASLEPDTEKRLRDGIALLRDALADAKMEALPPAHLASLRADVLALQKNTPLQWQYGLGVNSDGRFAMFNRDYGLNVCQVSQNRLQNSNFKTADGGNPTITFNPVGGKLTPAGAETTWISILKKYSARNEKLNRNIHWNVLASLAAPGILLDTDTDEITLSVKTSAQSGNGPARVGMMLDGKPALVKVEDMASLDWSRLSENWLLLIAENGMPEMPALLTLNKAPDRIEKSADGILFVSKGGIGTLGLATPWGARMFPRGFSKDWKSLPDEIVSRCRWINDAMVQYPYVCDEYFHFDDELKSLTVKDVFQYKTVANAWGRLGKKYAMLPPPLVYMRRFDKRLTIPDNAEDLDFPTKHGPYAAVPGDTAEYTLPVPDLRNWISLKTPAYGEDVLRVKAPAMLHFPWHGISNSPLYIPRVQTTLPIYQFWNWMTPAEQNELLLQASCFMPGLERNLKAQSGFKDIALSNDLRNGGSCEPVALERTEPLSGHNYIAYGWQVPDRGVARFGDITNFLGYCYLPYARWVQFSGEQGRRWVKENSETLKAYYRLAVRRSDWEGMGQDCMEHGLIMVIDMTMDSWLNSVGMYKMMDYCGGEDYAKRLALYVATKQLPAIMMNFHYRQWALEWANDWDVDKTLAEAGIKEEGYVNTPWSLLNAGCNFIAGSIAAEECYNSRRDFSLETARRFEYGTLEKYQPRWWDYSLRTASDPNQKINCAIVTQHLLLRAAVGESVDALHEMTSRDQNQKIRNPYDLQHMWALHPFLSGATAPCKLSEWFPARLLRAEWKPETGKAEFEFAASAPFTLNLMTENEPDTMTVNGEKIPFLFNKAGQSLSAKIPATGKLLVKADYAKWQFKDRARLAVFTPSFPLGEHGRMARAELELLDKNQDKDYAVGETACVPLGKWLNMALAEGPKTESSTPWNGLVSDKKENGVDSLKRGVSPCRGVPFKIEELGGNGAIGLKGNNENLKGLPQKIVIPIGCRIKNLYALQTAGWDANDERTVLRYTIYSRAGEKFIWDVRSGVEIADWWRNAKLPNAKTFSGVACKGHNVGLYVARWSNSKEKIGNGVVAAEQMLYHDIDRIEIESLGAAGSVAVLGITVELP